MEMSSFTSKPVSRVIISLILTAIAGAVYFYVELPALNLHSLELYFFIIGLCIVFSVCLILLGSAKAFFSNQPGEMFKYYAKKLPIPLAIIALALVVILVGNLAGAEIFRANAYAKLLTVENGDFASEVNEINWDQIPMLDDTSANNLANRKLGELSDLVSQFTVSGSSAQINYQNSPVRVTYLNYSNFFKWFNNRAQGIPAYMTIDMRTQEVNVVRLEEGIHYSPSEYFGRDMMRHLRFQYPTYIFEDVNFEIDEEGTPYWIASVVTRTIGLFGGSDVKGAVMMNAVTGECTYADVADIPSWVDRVYPTSLLIAQYDYRGLYTNGFFNALFSQSGCTETTDGYNYIALDDDVWMYTGITSVTSDEGNIGFILVNQRTKEARYYSCAGAEEYSAMSSAMGAVQQYGYQATFPLLLNISDQPTYFMALKDGAGLVKMYAMVNVQQYQIVATGYTLKECQSNYYDLLLNNNLVDADATHQDTMKTEDIVGYIEDIRSATIDGNTVVYLRLSHNLAIYYTVSVKDYPIAVILNVGDRVKLEYVPVENSPLMQVVTLELK